METIKNILSKQCAEIRFRNGIIEYFSLSTQHGTANRLVEAISNIVEAHEKYEGKTPFAYAMEKGTVKDNDKHGYWEQGDMYDIGDVCSLCGYDSCEEPCYLPECPSCNAKMETT